MPSVVGSALDSPGHMFNNSSQSNQDNFENLINNNNKIYIRPSAPAESRYMMTNPASVPRPNTHSANAISSPYAS